MINFSLSVVNDQCFTDLGSANRRRKFPKLCASAAGRFEIHNTTNNSFAVHATTNGTANAGLFRILNSANNSIALYGTTNGTGNAGVFEILNPGNVNSAVDGRTYGNGPAGVFVIQNTASTATALYSSTTGTGFALVANGRAWVRVLEIAGADLAEKFPASEDVKPGMVVEIDPNHAGKLRISREAYNLRVAGVVSGAGGLPTGAILGNLSGHEDAPPIALSGRVWVNCDAGAHAIEPGDLLTTSATPGHAMKVTHYSRAYGAVIGKAMTELAAGKNGLVLVLVSLQ